MAFGWSALRVDLEPVSLAGIDLSPRLYVQGGQFVDGLLGWLLADVSRGTVALGGVLAVRHSDRVGLWLRWVRVGGQTVKESAQSL